MNDLAYHTYLTLHLLETHTDLLNDLTCDERWTEAFAYYELWKRSEFNDYGRSHYECIEGYAKALNPTNQP
mgnify:FL=1